MSIRITIEIGHEATLRTKKTPEGYTHDWEIFVRGCNSEIHHYVEKVVFNLHETFPKPRRVVKEPPYCVKESGYAGFNLPIDIYLKNNGEPKKITFNYDLNLQQTGPAIIKVQKEKYVFPNVTDEFQNRLLKGGGTFVNTTTSYGDSGRDSMSANEDKTQLIGKPKLGGDLSKKHKNRPEEMRNSSSFTDLFGPPIKKPPEPKPYQKGSILKPEKLTSVDKVKNKHSPQKDKDSGRDKDHERKSKEEKHKDRSKERDSNKERTSKKEKSPRRSSPSPKRSPKRDPSPKKISSPKRGPSPLPKVKSEERTKYEDTSKEKGKSSESSKSEKKSKKDKRDKDKSKDREQKEHKSHKESKQDDHKKSKSISKESVKLVEEVSREKDQNKIKEKSKHLESSSNKETETKPEKPESGGDKHKHKHKKKDREKSKKDDKDRERKHEKKSEKNATAMLIKTSTIEETKPVIIEKEITYNNNPPATVVNNSVPEVKIKQLNPLNTLIKEISDDSSDSSNVSFNLTNTETKNSTEKPATFNQIETTKPPIIEKESKHHTETTKPEKQKKKHRDKSKTKNSEDSEKKRKRKNKDVPVENIVEDVPAEETNQNIVAEEETKEENCIPAEETIAKTFSPDYMTVLKELQQKIMTLQDNNELQRIVQLIAETGQYEITRQTFDFDLCALDRDTVRRLQDLFGVI